ncbi:acetamidase/formamidase family protein [Ferruginivarius sediminum]|uniref:Acetamidase/formamidase family protein n=2 Tax=Ferruginivarius sediminum TaxID=2661937 RepID=A0A369T870_9PROT|nr:acetamidase/formamidase family protein [Ferruginivarius sediminum]
MSARADTTDVKAWDVLRIEKTGTHCADDTNCMNRLHPAIEPVAFAKPGQHLVFETRDALDSDFDLNSQPEDVTAADLNLVHPMTGPVHIEGAKRGDVLAVTLLDIKPDQYGYTVIVPGFGFLRDRYTEPFIANWKLTRVEAVSDEIPGVAIPFNGFMGSVGVLPGEPELENILAREAALQSAGGVVLTPEPTSALPSEVCGPEGTHKDECLRTIPPRENGGNMDVKQMQIGTTLLLPCFVDGCGLFIGDVHYAQGDGEVSGTAIEMGAEVTVATEIRRGEAAQVKVPHFEGGDELKRLAPSEFYATTGFPLKEQGEVPVFSTYLDGEKIGPLENLSEDLTLAARNALVALIDWMVEEKGLTPQQAYVVASVAADLRIGQLVDVPNYTVSAIIPTTIFRE